MRSLAILILVLGIVPAAAYGSLQGLRWAGVTFWIRDVPEVEEYLVAFSGQGELAEVRRVLRSRRIGGEARDRHGRTALMAAASSGNIEVAKALIDAGASIDAAASGGHRREMEDATALMVAANRGDAPMATLLLDRGADPRLAIRSGPHAGATAMSLARQSGNLRLAELLAARAATPARPATP